MKKLITLLSFSFFVLVSCSKDDPTVAAVPTITTTQAVLSGATVTVTWPVVAGTDITYNVYRNDNPVKINAVPLTEATYTDVLTAIGDYTYRITVNTAGLESEKGTASEKVVFALPTAPVAQAVLNGGAITVTWPAVAGTGITYNIYKNGDPVKINASPLTEATYTDILTATGSYTYTIAVNVAGLESEKGAASGKVVLALPKTRIMESSTSTYNTKYEYAYTYDTSNIAKLVSVASKTTRTKISDQTVTVSNSIAKYTYAGDLITKIIYYSVDNVAGSSYEYVYNAKNQMTSLIRKKADGTINYTVNLTYDDNGRVTETSDYPNWGTWVYTYLAGNLVKYTYTLTQVGSTNYVENSNSVFDTKNTYSKNILGYNNTFTSSINNELSSSTTGGDGITTSSSSSRTEYTYDANDYVLTRTEYTTTDSSTEMQTEKSVYTYN